MAVVSFALAAALTGRSEDQPAVCSSVDSLNQSVENVKEIDVNSPSALADLESGLKGIEGGDLADGKADAQFEFASQIDAVESSYSGLQTSFEAAQPDASADTLAAAGTALSTFGIEVESLISDIESTCGPGGSSARS